MSALGPQDKRVTEYWFKYYLGDNMLCSLCGNSGIVDTIQTAISPMHIPSGKRNWCICPNGQAMRKQNNGLVPALDLARRHAEGVKP